MARETDPQITIATIAGYCPVQCEGWIDGKPFYFRARGHGWRIGIGRDPVMEPEWGYGEDYGDGPYDAGYMTQYEALGFIAKAIGVYANESGGTE